MNHKLLIGIAGGALALALAGGAVYAGPALKQAPAIVAQAATPTAQPDGTNAVRRQPRKAAQLVRSLIKAAADVTGTQPKDVLAALGDGKSLAQYAQEHGKTADNVVQAARTNLQDQLNQALSGGKLTQERADTLLRSFDEYAPQVVDNTNL